MNEKWFCLALGDGVLAEPVIAELAALSLSTRATRLPLALLLRRRQQGLHCVCHLYFTPGLHELAARYAARPCARPGMAGLELLNGEPGTLSWWQGHPGI